MWYFRYFPTSGKDGARLGSAICRNPAEGSIVLESCWMPRWADAVWCPSTASAQRAKMLWCASYSNESRVYSMYTKHICIYIIYIYIINYTHRHTVFMFTHLECRQFMNSSMMQLIWRAQMLGPTLPRNITHALNCKFPWDVNLSGCWEANP